MSMTHENLKLTTRGARALRLAALTPALALTGAWFDTMALRGNFRPVISSYHAICTQNRRDQRCERLIRFAPFGRTQVAKD